MYQLKNPYCQSKLRVDEIGFASWFRITMWRLHQCLSHTICCMSRSETQAAECLSQSHVTESYHNRVNKGLGRDIKMDPKQTTETRGKNPPPQALKTNASSQTCRKKSFCLRLISPPRSAVLALSPFSALLCLHLFFSLTLSLIFFN